MKSDYIKLADGTFIGIKDLKQKVSLKSIILDKVFFELCEFVAENYFSYEVGSSHYKTLVNLLFLKSNKLRTLASIIEFNRYNPISAVDFEFDLG